MSGICNDTHYDSDMVYIQILQKTNTVINKAAITMFSYISTFLKV